MRGSRWTRDARPVSVPGRRGRARPGWGRSVGVMGPGRKLGTAIVAAVIVGAATITTTSADAATKTITVTPHSGLHGGDTVQVKVSGFAAGSPVGVVQCANPVASPESCDLEGAIFVSANSHGEAT